MILIEQGNTKEDTLENVINIPGQVIQNEEEVIFYSAPLKIKIFNQTLKKLKAVNKISVFFEPLKFKIQNHKIFQNNNTPEFMVILHTIQHFPSLMNVYSAKEKIPILFKL